MRFAQGLYEVSTRLAQGWHKVARGGMRLARGFHKVGSDWLFAHDPIPNAKIQPITL